MSVASTPSLTGFAGWRSASVLYSKLVDAVAVIILIRLLSRADYGIVGLAGGWVVALSFLNINPENILWRDYRKLAPRLANFLGSCLRFWVWKTALLVALALVVAGAQFMTYRHAMILLYLPASAFFSLVVSLAFMFELPLAVGLSYRKVALVMFGLRTFWLALVITLMWRPTLGWLLAISAVYYAVHVGVWFAVYRRAHAIIWPPAGDARQTVREAMGDYVLWQHLANAARSFLQRGSLALLGLLGVALANVGNYLIGINVTTFALILPGVTEMTVAAGLAHSANATEDAQIVRRASWANFSVVLAQLLAFKMIGLQLLDWLAPGNATVVYAVAWPLVLGASVFALLTPLLAYAIARTPPADLWWRVHCPVAVLACITFAAGAFSMGLPGVAWAHVANSLALAVALWLHLRRSSS